MGSPRSLTASISVPPDQQLSRDALLLLLEYGAARGAQLVTVIDVRRHDERSLYGSIRGSVHLPVEQLPKALLAPAEDWLRAHHFRKPGADEAGPGSTDSPTVISRCLHSRRHCFKGASHNRRLTVYEPRLGLHPHC